jgi:hypothetical protein
MASLTFRLAMDARLSPVVPHCILGFVINIIGLFGSSFMLFLDIGVVFGSILLIGNLSLY